MKLHPQVETYQDAVRFYLTDDSHRGHSVARSITFEEAKQGEIIEPIFSLPMPDAQELFEKLWAQGFRSKHDKGNAAALDAARTEHIADLRKAAKLA